MSKQIVLHSLAELGAVFGLDEQATLEPEIEDVTHDTEPPEADAQIDAHAATPPPATKAGDDAAAVGGVSSDDASAPEVLDAPQVGAVGGEGALSHEGPDLAALLAELQRVGAELAVVAQRDEAARTLALRELEVYDRLLAAQQDAEDAQASASQVRQQAERLATTAFSDGAREQARSVVDQATAVEAQAGRVVAQRREETERLAGRLDVERLIAERRREQEAEVARAAAADRVERLLQATTAVRQMLTADRLEEATSLLAAAMREFPDSEELATLKDAAAQRARERTVATAEAVLRTVRSDYRACPEEAIACLEALDVDGLPEELGRQVFGEWAVACSRVCRRRKYADPLRYAPLPGRGAVLARERADVDYVVLSALGMGPRWRPGTTVAARDVSGARPLR